MPLLSLALTLCALYALYRLSDEEPALPSRGDPRRTAYIPLKWRRVWSVAALTLSLVTWLAESWGVFGAAMLAHLGVLVCRNARIVWDGKRLCISGMSGLRWDYEYARLRYLPGRLPFIAAGGRLFILWPGMVWRDTFLAEAREHVRVAAYAQRYRKRGYRDTRQNAASRNALLTNIALAFLIGALAAYFTWPVTADSGETEQLVLLEAQARNDDRITLAFEDSGDCRIVLNDRTAPLLEADAVGRTYTVQRQYRPSLSKYHRSGWYSVLALSDDRGVVYRTWEESAAARAHTRPQIIALCGVAWFALKQNGCARTKHRR